MASLVINCKSTQVAAEAMQFLRRLSLAVSKTLSASKPNYIVKNVPVFPLKQPKSIAKENPIVTGTDLLTFLRREQRLNLNADNRWSIFDRRSPENVGVGSILKVTFCTSKTESNRPSTFVGVLIAVRRNEADPTFILRSIVDGVGVEQLFPVFSPMITKIEVVKKAIKQKSKKAYWLREKPEKALEFISPKHK